MSVADSLVDPLLGLSGNTAYSISGTLAFEEAGLLIGFVLPVIPR